MTPATTCGTDRGYGRHRRAKEPACASCTAAHTAARRDRRYGLAPGEWDAMLLEQNGRCFTCGAEPSAGLVMDHDHHTGEKRRALCGFCNLALGHALESPEILRRLTLYVEGNLRAAPDRFLGDLSKKGLRKRSGPLYKARRQ